MQNENHVDILLSDKAAIKKKKKNLSRYLWNILKQPGTVVVQRKVILCVCVVALYTSIS